MAGLRPAETDRMVAILRKLNRESGLTILLIEHVMRAVMALASRVLVLHHGAAIARRHARRRGARAGGDRVLSRRGGGRDAARREPRRLPRRRAGARRRLARHRRRARSSPSSARTAPARPRSSAPSPACTGRRAGASCFRGTDIAGWPSHRVCDLGIGQVAEGRQVFPTLSVAENLDMGAMLPRARAGRARNLERVFALFPVLAERAGRRPARSRAASSRCSRSAAA